MNVLRRLVESRTTKHKWVYLLCAPIFLLMGWISIAQAEDIRAATPSVIIVLLLVVQFYRPTLLGWLVLLFLFLGIGVGILLQATSWQDGIAGLLVGLVPGVVLLWTRPQRMTGTAA